MSLLHISHFYTIIICIFSVDLVTESRKKETKKIQLIINNNIRFLECICMYIHGPYGSRLISKNGKYLRTTRYHSPR